MRSCPLFLMIFSSFCVFISIKTQLVTGNEFCTFRVSDLVGGKVTVQRFSYRHKCIGYKSVQHKNIRRAIQKKEMDHESCDRNKSLSRWHLGWRRVGKREVKDRGVMTSHTLIDFNDVGSIIIIFFVFFFLILQL